MHGTLELICQFWYRNDFIELAQFGGSVKYGIISGYSSIDLSGNYGVRGDATFGASIFIKYNKNKYL